MSVDDEAGRALNRIAAILQIAHKDALANLRGEIVSDKTSEAFLAVTGAWITNGALTDAAMKKGAASIRAGARRLPELVEQGILERRQVRANVEYRTTGRI